MTREEAIKWLKTFKGCTGMAELSQAFDVAIETLEQQSVLDKIKAEIKALSPEPTIYDIVERNPKKDAVWETVNDVSKIIDKYKESSEK